MSVATRLAWSFTGLFAAALVLVAALFYYELVIEPKDWTEQEKLLHHGSAAAVVMEVAVGAAVPLFLLALGGWWLARCSVRPVEALAAAAARLHEGNLTERVPLRGTGDEFDRLADAFNEMAARMDASFQRVHDFTLYASHELKTPLAILRADIEQFSQEPPRTEDEKERLASQLDEIDRLAKIVDGLSFLTKADARLIPLERKSVALKALVLDAAEDAHALGTALGITVNLAACEQVSVTGDRHRLRQLLLILCDNAVNYNRPGGEVRLSLEKKGADAVLCITNTGEGIPADEQSSVFQRFYRSKSSRKVDGSGLGLSIAQWITGEHGGNLTCASAAGITEFRLALPVE